MKVIQFGTEKILCNVCRNFCIAPYFECRACPDTTMCESCFRLKKFSGCSGHAFDVRTSSGFVNVSYAKKSKRGDEGANPVDLDIERYKCPVCYQIPEDKVFQCNNGHVLCEKCTQKLILCPQCRITIEGARKGRNRIMEELLDDFKLDCQFYDKGCKKKLKRGELTAHRLSCEFGPLVSVCKVVGIDDDCKFKTNPENVDGIFEHLQTVHGVQTSHATRMGTMVQRMVGFFNFPDCIPGSAVLASHELLQFENPLERLLFVVKLKNHHASWIFVNLGETDNSSLAQTRVKISSDQSPNVSWEVPIIGVKQLEDNFRNPVVKICIPQLKTMRIPLVGVPVGEDNDYIVRFDINV